MRGSAQFEEFAVFDELERVAGAGAILDDQ